MEDMTKIEMLIVLLSLEALLEEGNTEKALEIIKKAIAETKK